jgi:Domain of unknown function (DUF4129)
MRRWLPIVLLVVAATAVVAIGAAGTGLLLPSARLAGGWGALVRITGAAAAVAGVVALVLQRRRLLDRDRPTHGRSNQDRRYDPTVAAFATAATLMVLMAALSLLAPARVNVQGSGGTQVASQPSPTDGEAGRRPRGSVPSNGGMQGLGLGLVRGSPGVGGSPVTAGAAAGDVANHGYLGRLAGFLVLVILFGATVLGILALTGRLGRRRPSPPLVPVAAEDAEAGLEASLGEVAYDGPDPRRQITAAYHRLLHALSEAGAPREPQEAPHEHLYRVLGPLGVRAEPMHTLTELYVIAQFTERPIHERHRIAAAGALEAGLSSLRSANPSATRAGAAAP